MITVEKPKNFNFISTVLSHGWHELPPFRFAHNTNTLYRTQKLHTGLIVHMAIFEKDGHIIVETGKSTLTSKETIEIQNIVKRVLEIDKDLTDFYKLLRNDTFYNWVIKKQLGYLLVSPTVWEDVVKTLFTTNTTWNITVNMCERIVKLGDFYNGSYCFPTPQQIASNSFENLDNQVRAGYRTAYLYELANRICDNEINIELLHDSEKSTVELYKEIKKIKGLGDYSSATILRLLRRYDKLAIDTACRNTFKSYMEDNTDFAIKDYYSRFGNWQALVSWMDIMKTSHMESHN
jgi:3-methyladenine DNA glycosylase/8-oxoguanine DNA glycosylase